MNEERELPPEVMEAIKAGHTIEAIKRLRRARGLGLKEAKDIVDAESAKHPRRGSQPGISTHGTGVFGVVLALLVAALAAAVYYFISGG